MPRRVSTLDTNRAHRPTRGPWVVFIPPFDGGPQAGATLFSWLIYPAPEDERDRRDVRRAIGFEAVRSWACKNPDAPPIPMPPEYLIQTEQERHRILRKASTRLGSRLAAVRIAWPLLIAVAVKQPNKKAKRLTIAARAESARSGRS
jgi:hypothetical protein